MASESKVARREISPYLIVIAVIAIAALVGLSAYWNFTPHEGTTSTGKMTPEMNEFTEWLKQKAKESGGDISKLSPEDQAKLNKDTHGMGTVVLKGVYEKNR